MSFLKNINKKKYYKKVFILYIYIISFIYNIEFYLIKYKN